MANSLPETGGLRDPHDSRDIPLFSAEEFQQLAQGTRPSADGAAATNGQPFILSDLPPIYNQGRVGSCTANAACAALRYAHRRATGRSYESFQPSRLFAWYYGRIATDPANFGKNETSPLDVNAVTHNKGSWARAVIHAFLVHGVCTENLWPYGTPTYDESGGLFNGLSKPPNPAEPEDWSNVSFDARPSTTKAGGKVLLGMEDNIPRSISYYRVFDPSIVPMVSPTTGLPTSSWDVAYNKASIPVLEKVLRDGFPFIFETDTFGDKGTFYSTQFTNGVYNKPGVDLKRVSGHTMMAVGYDAAKRLFYIQNSWGEDYYGPTGGRFWMPYEWFELEINNSPVVRDFWVIKWNGQKA